MDEETQRIWDLYFSGVVGWQLHPGYLKEGVEAMNLEECAAVVDEMIRVRNERCRGL